MSKKKKIDIEIQLKGGKKKITFFKETCNSTQKYSSGLIITSEKASSKSSTLKYIKGKEQEYSAPKIIMFYYYYRSH